MVKDGLPGGETTQQISVMVRKSNAGPVAQISVLTAAAYTAMSRVDANRIASTGAVTVDVPDGAFFDADSEVLTVTAAVGGDNPAAIAANKAILGVSIDGNGDLVLTPKKGSANADIPVILTATDRYGKTAVTTTGRAEGIQVHVNTPPTFNTYESGDAIPAGKKEDDKKALADIVDKTFSVSAQATAVAFIELATYFVDPDTLDTFTGANSICDFVTVPADQKNAEVTFDTARANIQIKA